MSSLLGLGTAAKAAVVATALVLTLVVAGAAAGVVDLPGGNSSTAEMGYGLIDRSGASDAGSEPASAVSVPEYGDVQPLPSNVQTVAPPGETAPARSRSTQPAPTQSGAAAPTPAPVQTAPAPVPAPAPAPSPVARRTPSAAEVDQAIKAMPQYIKTPFPATPALVAEVGNQVCTAFDQGRTFAEVKTTGLQMLTQLPRTTVLPGGADWAVRTVVALYCPGHAPKLA